MKPEGKSKTLCPCQSGKFYSECCELYHLGKASPQTAELLMRSRYTAYVKLLWAYIVDTTHPSTRSRNLQKELQETNDNPQWSGLKILKIKGGQQSDKTGKVEFEASYFLQGQFHSLHEHSRFKRFKGVWKYLDAGG